MSTVIATSVSHVNPRTPEALSYDDVCVPGVEYNIHACPYVKEKSVITHFHVETVITP